MITRDTLTREERQIYDEIHRYPIFLSTKDFEKLTGYSRATAYRLIEEGQLSTKHITLTKGSKPTRRLIRESMLELMLKWNKE